MSSNTLDSLGRAILETLGDERIAIDTLEATFETSRETLEDRLSQLVDNALIREVADGEYELTDNGRRVLHATPGGEYDNRIDTPSAVERSIEEFSLPPDAEQAVRNTFSFLQYWGDATTAELVDGCYSESPAGYDTADAWWEDCIEERLRVLPLVDPPETDSDDSIPERWEYENTPVVETPDDEDGRDVADPDSATPSFGSVRHGLEKLELTEGERTAARVAFSTLSERGAASALQLADEGYEDYPAEYDSSDEWASWLTNVFAELPGIECDSESTDEAIWEYSHLRSGDYSRVTPAVDARQH